MGPLSWKITEQITSIGWYRNAFLAGVFAKSDIAVLAWICLCVHSAPEPVISFHVVSGCDNSIHVPPNLSPRKLAFTKSKSPHVITVVEDVFKRSMASINKKGENWFTFLSFFVLAFLLLFIRMWLTWWLELLCLQIICIPTWSVFFLNFDLFPPGRENNLKCCS